MKSPKGRIATLYLAAKEAAKSWGYDEGTTSYDIYIEGYLDGATEFDDQ